MTPYYVVANPLDVLWFVYEDARLYSLAGSDEGVPIE